MDNKFYFECVNCGSKYFYDEADYLCPECTPKNDSKTPPIGVLKAVYNYKKILELGKYLKTFDRLVNTKFVDLFPLYSVNSFSFLDVGNTPLYRMQKLDGKRVDFGIFIKDDCMNPSYSLKDRASNLVAAYAIENDYDTLVTASTGNAGASMATICASLGLEAVVIVPATTPKAKMMQILMAGAKIITVDGTYDDAFKLSMEASREFGWYNRNTAYNPFTIDGKKTVAFEIYKQLGQQTPNTVFVPVGDGSIISGVYKGFEDLIKLDIFKEMPKIVAVQAEGSNNLTKNLNADNFNFTEPDTIADSLKVKIPANFYMTKIFMDEYKGESITVNDNEITQAAIKIGKATGLFVEPSAAAAYAGIIKYNEAGKLKAGTRNVVLLTGTGLKDPLFAAEALEMPKPIEPTIEGLKKIL